MGQQIALERPLPEGWRWVRLGEVCKTTSGGTPARGMRDFFGGSIPWVKSGELNDGLIVKTEEGITQNAIVKSSAKVFPAGTLLIALYGATVGKLGVLGMDAATNQAVCAIFPDESCCRDYLFFYLLKEREALLSTSFGGAQPNISQGIVRQMLIPLPSVEEQNRIVAILNEQMGAVERARASTEAQLEATKVLPAAYLRAVFSSPEAQQWSKKPIGELCEITARQVDPKIPEYGRLPHVNGENIESGTCRLLSVRTAEEDAMISGKYLFEPGDVLYSKLRPYLRKVTVADFRGVCSADMYPVRVNRSLLDQHYTAWMLLSDDFTSYADEESRRARMPKLNRDQLFAWSAPVPSLHEQQRIAATLNEQMTSVKRARKAIEEELDAINKLPAALLRRTFSGALQWRY